MAMLISRATGNFTASSTWGVADSATGSQLTNPTAATSTTTSYVYSSTFTGTNTSVANGVVLFLKRLTTTGTFSVALSDDNGVTATREVTVNASDLPANESWVFFEFGSTLTLDGGTDYRVGVVSSSASSVSVYRDATAGNWARMICTTATAAPAAGDTFLIVGEQTGAGASNSFTVTMDNTATTSFGTYAQTGSRPTQTSPGTYNGLQVGKGGTLTWGTSAATNYYVRMRGHVSVWDGGTYNMGTSSNPCPRNSTMSLFIDSNGTIGAFIFGFSAFNGSSVSLYGQSRTSGKDIVSCKLSANASANATSVTVDTDTGWLNDDRIAVASTSRTRTECETGALNANAGASTLSLKSFGGTGGGLAFAHSGTSPAQAEIINLTRNVKIFAVSTSRTFFFYVYQVAAFDAYWTEFRYLSIGNENFMVIAAGSGVTCSVAYCSFSDVPSSSNTVSIGGSGTTIFNYNVFYNLSIVSNSATVSATPSGSGSSISNNIIMLCAGSSGSARALELNITGSNGTFENNTVVGCEQAGVIITVSTNSATVGGVTAHSNSGVGITILSSTGANTEFTFNNFSSWRNNNTGITNTTQSAPSTYTPIHTYNNAIFFGNATTNFAITQSGITRIFNNCIFSGDTSFSTTNGIVSTVGGVHQYYFNDCQFSPSGGIYAAQTTDISIAGVGTPQWFLNDTRLGAATEIGSLSNMSQYSYIRSSKHDQTEGAFKSWFANGIIERDTTIFNTASPSERLTPNSASLKLASGPRVVAVDDLGTITINVYVRKSTSGDGAAYNGNQPRLIVRANPACGINSNTVLDTMTVGTGTWELLTGTTAAVDADGALEFFVDCDGTAGWINVDDWSVS